MTGFWSTPHLLLGESVFSLIQGKFGSQHYSFLFATQQLFSSLNVVFSKGPAWTANMEVLRSCPSHVWHSSFHIFTFLTIIYLFSLFTSLLWLYSAIWCSSNMPRTLHFRTLSLVSFLCLERSLTRYTLLSHFIYEVKSFIVIHEDKSFLHCLTSNLEIQEHPPNIPSPSSLP